MKHTLLCVLITYSTWIPSSTETKHYFLTRQKRDGPSHHSFTENSGQWSKGWSSNQLHNPGFLDGHYSVQVGHIPTDNSDIAPVHLWQNNGKDLATIGKSSHFQDMSLSINDNNISGKTQVQIPNGLSNHENHVSQARIQIPYDKGTHNVGKSTEGLNWYVILDGSLKQADKQAPVGFSTFFNNDGKSSIGEQSLISHSKSTLPVSHWSHNSDQSKSFFDKNPFILHDRDVGAVGTSSMQTPSGLSTHQAFTGASLNGGFCTPCNCMSQIDTKSNRRKITRQRNPMKFYVKVNKERRMNSPIYNGLNFGQINLETTTHSSGEITK